MSTPFSATIMVAAQMLADGALEAAEHVRDGPSRIAQRRPFVAILRLPAVADHAVDRGGAAERAPLRQGDASPVRSMPGPWSTMRVMDAPADDAFRAAAKETGVSWKSAWLNPRILSTADSI
jgi:hypothetical protein